MPWRSRQSLFGSLSGHDNHAIFLGFHQPRRIGPAIIGCPLGGFLSRRLRLIDFNLEPLRRNGPGRAADEARARRLAEEKARAEAAATTSAEERARAEAAARAAAEEENERLRAEIERLRASR